MSDLTERLRRMMTNAPSSTNARIAAFNAADALEAAEAKLAAIDALHEQGTDETTGFTFCYECTQLWPCPTHRILHPEEEQ